MRKPFNFISLIAMIVLTSFQFPSSESSSGVKFYSGSYDEMLREARKQKKGVILDFWASWCGPCKKMDNETFKDPSLANYVSNHFLIYKVDADSFDGMEITEKYAIEAFPSLLIMDHKGQFLKKYKGFYHAHYLESELKNVVETYHIFPKAGIAEFASN